MSNERSPAYPTGQVSIYNRYFEYERVVSHVSVTDEGVYKMGEVPDTYGGAQLDLELVHAVFVVNSKGEMLMLEFFPEEAMDTERKRGGPTVRDGQEILPGAGPSTVPITQTTVPNTKLDPARQAIGAFAKGVFKNDVGFVNGQVSS